MKSKSLDRKYEVCSECGLNIRCGNRERHEAGYHHKHRLETLAQVAREAKIGR